MKHTEVTQTANRTETDELLAYCVGFSIVILSGELKVGFSPDSEFLGDQQRKIANATAPATMMISTIINPLVNSMERSTFIDEIMARPAQEGSSKQNTCLKLLTILKKSLGTTHSVSILSMIKNIKKSSIFQTSQTKMRHIRKSIE